MAVDMCASTCIRQVQLLVVPGVRNVPSTAYSKVSWCECVATCTNIFIRVRAVSCEIRRCLLLHHATTMAETLAQLSHPEVPLGNASLNDNGKC